MNPAHERRAREILLEELPGLHISLSTDILPEPPEFERTATTVANAYCAPVLRNYMDTLEEALAGAGFKADVVLVMHNGGGTMTTDYAKGVAVKTLNSGPAAGVIAAAAVAASAGRANVVGFDMGGTSADIAVVRDGEPQLTRSFDLELGMPIRFPSIDLVSIGAGGGSIAWLDPAGYPRSRAAERRRRSRAGLLRQGRHRAHEHGRAARARARQQRPLPRGRAWSSTPSARPTRCGARIAEPLGLSLEDAAEGVLEIANANMVKAIRVVTVERGLDPREFGLLAFGGAGALHAVELARELQMPEVIVPPSPGVTSAMGLLFVDPLDDFSLGLRRAASTRSTSPTPGASSPRWRSAWWATSSARASSAPRSPSRRPSTSATSGSSTRSRCRCPRSARRLHGRRRELPRRAPAPVPLLAPRDRRSSSRRCGSAARGRRDKPDLTSIAHAGASARRRQRASGRCISRARLGRDPRLDRTGLRAGDSFDGPCIVEQLDSDRRPAARHERRGRRASATS